MDCLRVGTAIVGGGAAGLWLLNVLRQRGQSAVLIENSALGQGQTVASQGILHSGLKYSLQGLLTASAREAREMPNRWRRCLQGQETPDLTGTEVRSESFYLWGTDSTVSRLGLMGARLALQVAPQRVALADCPPLLRGSERSVLQVAEQVISPVSLLETLAGQHPHSILAVDRDGGITWERDSHGRHTLRLRSGAEEMRVEAETIVLTAGQGNAVLREQAGLSTTVMQRRPLQMMLVRGKHLPEFYGHCVDGAVTRVSITSARDASGRIVWQVGGQVSEVGVTMDRDTLIRHTQQELRAVVPAMNWQGTEWSTYRVDRAEGATLTGGRPESFKLIRDGQILTAWPTKLVLVPQLVDAILAQIPAHSPAATKRTDEVPGWPRPAVAVPPWEQPQTWIAFAASHSAVA